MHGAAGARGAGGAGGGAYCALRRWRLARDEGGGDGLEGGLAREDEGEEWVGEDPRVGVLIREQLLDEHELQVGYERGHLMACPISTGRGTRRVRLVRGEGRDVST